MHDTPQYLIEYTLPKARTTHTSALCFGSTLSWREACDVFQHAAARECRWPADDRLQYRVVAAHA